MTYDLSDVARLEAELDTARHERDELRARIEKLTPLADQGAQLYLAAMRRDTVYMRSLGLSFQAIRTVLNEYANDEVSFSKLVELLRAAARIMAEDDRKAATVEIEKPLTEEVTRHLDEKDATAYHECQDTLNRWRALFADLFTAGDREVLDTAAEFYRLTPSGLAALDMRRWLLRKAEERRTDARS